MQRLFSTFPNHLAGVGLLILRLTAGLPLLIAGVTESREASEIGKSALGAVEVVSGLLLLAGLWTPFAAIVGTLLACWFAFSQSGLGAAPILLAGVSAGIAMVGPGAWSLDSRLFGRKRIEVPDNRP